MVQAHGWVSQREFLDGLALSQITSGPIVITSAFLGYKLGGMAGAALATFAIFSPSIAMMLVFTEIFGRIRHLKWGRGELAGVLAAFVGPLAATLLGIAFTGLGLALSYEPDLPAGATIILLAGTAYLLSAAGRVIWLRSSRRRAAALPEAKS